MVIFTISVSRNNQQRDTNQTDNWGKQPWSLWLKVINNAAWKASAGRKGWWLWGHNGKGQMSETQSSLPLLSRGCRWVERGHGCGSQASAITLPNIAIYSSLTPNDYLTPLMRSVIFCPDSAGFKRATQRKRNSSALLRKMNKKAKSQPPASPHNFLMSCWKFGFKTSFRSSHKRSPLTNSIALPL